MATTLWSSAATSAWAPPPGGPTAFRTGYRRNAETGGPDFSLTVREIYLPGRVGAAGARPETGVPLMRSVSASYDNRARLTNDVEVQYGFTMDSVSFLDRMNNFSPYARVIYSTPEGGELAFVYTSGNARPNLDGQSWTDGGLQSDMSALGVFPSVSVRGGRSTMQRGDADYEVDYSRQFGSRKVQASVYGESVTNAALTMVAPTGFYSSSDLLPDLFGGNSFQRRLLSEPGLRRGRYAGLGLPRQRDHDVRLHGRADRRRPGDRERQPQRAARHLRPGQSRPWPRASPPKPPPAPA